MHRIQSLLAVRFPENTNEIAIPPRPRAAFDILNVSVSPESQRSSVTFTIPESSSGSGNPSSSEEPQDSCQSASTRSSSMSTPRKVTYADQDTVLRVAVHRSSVPSISEILNRIEPWKKEIAFFLLEHMKKKHHGSHFDRFITWFFEKHVNLNPGQCHKLFDASRSKNLNLLSETEIPKYVVSEICIKSAVQILIDHSASLSGVNLSGMDLTTIHVLPNTDFSNANLRFACLVGMNLNGINLSNANLMNAKLNKSSLRDAILSDAILDGAKLSEVDLTNANLSRVRLAEIRPNGPDFSFAKLDYANLKWANFTSALFHGSTLYGSDCSSVNFRYAKFEDANLDHANLACADFTDATLDSVSFINALNQSFG